jgi:CheY-like chemotaxis protein
MDGYQAARAIRELPGYAHTPLLALTADTPDEVRSHPEAVHFQDVITKPFDPQELRQKVLRYARSGGSAPSSPKSKKASVDEAAPNGLNLLRVREIFLDEESVRQFLENAINELTNLQAQYSQAVTNRNAAALSDMAHRMKMLLDMLQLNNVQDLLEQSRNMVEGSVDEEALQEVQSQTEARLEEVCALLQQYLEGKEEG